MSSGQSVDARVRRGGPGRDIAELFRRVEELERVKTLTALSLSWAYGAYRAVTVPSDTVSTSMEFEYFATNEADDWVLDATNGRIESELSGTFLVISAHLVLGLAADSIPLTTQVQGSWATLGPGLNEHSNLSFGDPKAFGYVPEDSITGDGVWRPNEMGLTSVRGGGAVGYFNTVSQESGSDMQAYGQMVVIQISENYDEEDFDVTPGS